MKARSSAVWNGTFVVVILGALMSPTLYVVYANYVDVVLPVTSASLECESIELGTVDPGAEIPIKSVLHNRSRRIVRLSQPVTSCGCVMARKGPEALQPGEITDLHLTYRAPSRPGLVNRSVVLTAKDFPAVSWTIAIRGEVSAPIWAEPPQIDVETDSKGTAEIIVKVHHDQNLSIGGVRTESNEIQLEMLADQNGVQPIKVSILGAPSQNGKWGVATIDLMDGHDRFEKLLSIPVTWKMPSKIECFPTTVTLNSYGSYVGDVVRMVLIRGLDESERERLAIKPLQDWIRIGER